MKKKFNTAKWFAIATEGATTDGRNISRQWIEQMAANYNPKTYGARINLEHLRGIVPDSVFKAYGDILALKAEEVDGKMKLFAQIDPTDELVEMTTKNRQKVYSSMEVDPDFAGTGQAYLVGMAVTDTPASLGTEMLQFSATAKQNPLAGRKQRPENLFSAAEPVTFEFAEVNEGSGQERTSLLDKVKALFAKQRTEAQADFNAFHDDLEQTLTLFAERANALEAQLAEKPDATTLTAMKEQIGQLSGAFDELKNQFTQLESTPGTSFERSPATGGSQLQQTNC